MSEVELQLKTEKVTYMAWLQNRQKSIYKWIKANPKSPHIKGVSKYFLRITELIISL